MSMVFFAVDLAALRIAIACIEVIWIEVVWIGVVWSHPGAVGASMSEVVMAEAILTGIISIEVSVCIVLIAVLIGVVWTVVIQLTVTRVVESGLSECQCTTTTSRLTINSHWEHERLDCGRSQTSDVLVCSLESAWCFLMLDFVKVIVHSCECVLQGCRVQDVWMSQDAAVLQPYIEPGETGNGRGSLSQRPSQITPILDGILSATLEQPPLLETRVATSTALNATTVRPPLESFTMLPHLFERPRRDMSGSIYRSTVLDMSRLVRESPYPGSVLHYCEHRMLMMDRTR